MNIKEMRALPPEEIASEVAKLREKIWKLRFQAKGEPVENLGALRAHKKDVARLLTVLSEKKRSPASKVGGGSAAAGRAAAATAEQPSSESATEAGDES